MNKSQKILIDLGSLTVTPYSGVGQVAIQYMKQLKRQQSSDIEFHLLLKSGTDSTLFSSKLPIHYTDKSNDNLLFKLVQKSYQKKYTLQQDFQLRHALTYVASIPRQMSDEPLIITIHDANPLVLGSNKHSKFFYRMSQAIEQADMLVFISHYAREVVASYFDLSLKKTAIIYNGVNCLGNGIQPKYLSINRPFFLFIGRVVAAKNIHLLVIMMYWLPDTKLVIAGNLQQDPSYVFRLKTLIFRYRLSDRVILVGKVSESDKVWFLENCLALLLPSKAEGFGLPVIEAFHYGKPVFISNLTALPEIGGTYAYYWPDLEPQIMADVIKNTFNSYLINSINNIQKRKQRAKKFSWQHNVNAYLTLYKKMLEGAI